MMQHELTEATIATAQTIAGAFGLGDDVMSLDEWPVDDGDSVIVVRLGVPELQLCIAVNEDVATGLSNSPDVLDQGIRAAADAIAAQLALPQPLSVLGVERSTVTMPQCVVGILDQGTLTALVGITDLAAPVQDIAPPPVSEIPAPPPVATSEFRPDPIAPEAPRHAPPAAVGRTFAVLHDVDLLVTAELGRTTMPVRELLDLAPGMVVEIDRAAGAPIDLLVNGRRIASGEVVVIDEEFGVRITEILESDVP